MPYYYLHLELISGLILEDEEGEEQPNSEAARLEALGTARELLAAAIMSGRELESQAVLVTDDRGCEVARVPLAAALPHNLRRE
jgi:hypothetical protein